ncbi:MAG: efflux RND transporter periplasmic adaptor subunit [Robiginitomaculum sp.]|nr:efflux RND transporter periplasmic adaptor subunit [Robiginitomaculum sp.]
MTVQQQANEVGIKRKPKDKKLIVGRVIFFLLPLIILVMGIVVLVIMSALKPELEKTVTEIKAVPVLVTSPSQEEVRLNVFTQGEVSPRVEIDVVPQVGGKIEYISKNFLEGGAFSKNEVLIRIETADYDLRVVQAEATVAQAKQGLLREQAEAQIAARDWEELGSGEASALTLRKPQMAQAEASLAAANASLADAKLQLARTAIRAPFAGRVRSKAADVGQFVTPGARLARIFSTEVVDVRLPFSDAELAKLNLPMAFVESENNRGPEVKLSAIVAGKPRTWQGRITRTDSAIDPTTRLMFAFVEVLEPYGAGADDGMPLVVGLFVQAEVEGQVLPDAMLIPRSALRGNNDVFLADGDELRIVSVEVASSNRNNAIITSGLSIDDKVITSPVRGAHDGMIIATVARNDVLEITASGE